MSAGDTTNWIRNELTSLLGIDVASAEDIATYMVSITDQEEVLSFAKELLCSSSEAINLNGPQKEFLQELSIRWKRFLVPDNVTVYRKENDELKTQFAKSVIKASKQEKNPFDMTSLKSVYSDSDISPNKKSKKKATYVSLYGKDGKMKTNAVMLPGRNSCECQAQKHTLINNCLKCGRIVCEQEGSGPCLFCGEIVCTKEEKEVLARNSNKSSKLRNKLASIPGGGALTKATNNDTIANALDKARAYKERLLNYDRTCAQRTQVIDDESDYYSTDSNVWLSEKERKYLQKKEAEIREMRHGSRLNKKFTLDFAGRQVLEDTYATNDDVMPSNFDDDYSESFHNNELSLDCDTFPDLINPSIKGNTPTFIPGTLEESSIKLDNVWNMPNNRLQDKQLMEMSDPGMCLSMHQPWASLLVRGIKKDEGRSWYSSHRGRLWIAAAAKQPSKDDIKTVENHHRKYWEATGHIEDIPEFPKEYPVGCLLGCVGVKEVLSLEEYEKAYPLGESGAAFVFVCDNPFELNIKFPVKGKHKIWKLEPKLHRAAKAALNY